MSLINKVLRDLEAQQEGRPQGKAKAVYEDLRAVSPVRAQRLRRALLLAGVTAASIVVVFFAWNQLSRFWFSGAAAPLGADMAPVAETARQPVPPPSPETKAAVAVPAPQPAARKEPQPAAPLAKSGNGPVVSARQAAQDTVVRKPSKVVALEPDGPKAENAPLRPAPDGGEPAAAAAATAEKGAVAGTEPETGTAVGKEEARVALTEKPKALPPRAVAEERAAKTVLEKKVKPLSPEEKAESEYRQAVTGLQQKRTGEAEGRLRAALTAYPAHIKARELLVGIALQNGRAREAQSLLEQGLNLNPSYYPFAQLLARVYVDSGAEKKSLELLEKSRAAAGSDPEYAAFLATLYQRAGRHADAIKAFSEAVSLRPREGRWWLGLAISLEAGENWKAAGEAYQRAMNSGNLDKSLLTFTQQRLAVVGNK